MSAMEVDVGEPASEEGDLGTFATFDIVVFPWVVPSQWRQTPNVSTRQYPRGVKSTSISAVVQSQNTASRRVCAIYLLRGRATRRIAAQSGATDVAVVALRPAVFAASATWSIGTDDFRPGFGVIT